MTNFSFALRYIRKVVVYGQELLFITAAGVTHDATSHFREQHPAALESLEKPILKISIIVSPSGSLP